MKLKDIVSIQMLAVTNTGRHVYLMSHTCCEFEASSKMREVEKKKKQHF